MTGWDNGFTDKSGKGLPYTYYYNWAYLTELGVENKQYPVLIGEFGAPFDSSKDAIHPETNNEMVS